VTNQHVHAESDLPAKLAAPARRALAGAGIMRLESLAGQCEADVRKLHGMGPKALDQLRSALAERGSRSRMMSNATYRRRREASIWGRPRPSRADSSPEYPHCGVSSVRRVLGQAGPCSVESGHFHARRLGVDWWGFEGTSRHGTNQITGTLLIGRCPVGDGKAN
jgi:hypothetical protein